MSSTARALDFQHIGTAWRFVLDCEDEDPRAYGVDGLPLRPMRRDGVHRQRVYGALAEVCGDAWGYEDALIASLEEEREEEGEEVLGGDAVAERPDEEEVTGNSEPLWVAAPGLTADADDPAEGLVKCEGLGHRAPREVLLLRFAA